jgi:hypothetical protein
MYRRLRLVVPLVQTLLVVGSFAWYKVAGSLYVLSYVYVVRDIVLKLNYPAFALWFPIVRLMDRFPGYFSPSHIATRVGGLLVIILAFLLSVALFWYLFLLELEMRRHGRSMIRFSSCLGEIAKAVLFVIVGIGALVYAYRGTKQLFDPLRSKADVYDAYIGGLFLVAWGLAFIGVSIRDLTAFVRKKGSTRSPAP